MPEKNYDKMLKVYGAKPIDLGEPMMENKEKSNLDPRVKRNWEDIQKRYQYPVNAIGVKIDPKDKETLRVWRENGIDKFLKS